MKQIKKTAKACETKLGNACGVNENFRWYIWMGKRITTVQGENGKKTQLKMN